VDHHTTFAVALLQFPISAPRALPYVHKHESTPKCAMHGVQSEI
jgi:hypothetical protein